MKTSKRREVVVIIGKSKNQVSSVNKNGDVTFAQGFSVAAKWFDEPQVGETYELDIYHEQCGATIRSVTLCADLSKKSAKDRDKVLAHIENGKLNKMSAARERDLLSGIVGALVVYGISPWVKYLAKSYIHDGGKYIDFAQSIILAAEGKEKQAAREALRMILIDLDFVEVDNVRL